MTITKKFHWNEETLEAFKFDAKHQTYAQVKEDVEFFVASDCQLEDGETQENLVIDLINQIYFKPSDAE